MYLLFQDNKMVKKATRKQASSKRRTPVKAKKIVKPQQAKDQNIIHRTYYTLKEDSNILQAMKNNKITSIEIKQLSSSLGRTYESIRDRVRRFLSQLSAEDQKTLLKTAKKEPENYVAFVTGKNGQKKIE